MLESVEDDQFLDLKHGAVYMLLNGLRLLFQVQVTKLLRRELSQ